MKKITGYFLLTVCLVLSLAFSIPAGELPLVYDEADMLTDWEEEVLLSRLEGIRDTYKMDVVVAVVDSIGMSSPMEYADDFYDFNGYGQGPNHDGLVLLISMEYSDWWISTCGYAITVFTDAGISYIGEQVVPYLSDGDFAGAFDEFADQCEAFIIQAREGEPFDIDNLPKEPFEPGITLLISMVVGLIFALIYTGHLKGQLNTVRKQHAASSYVKDGSLNLTASQDFFLYRNVKKTPRQTSSSSGGGSSTHRSSSGRSHGGGGGKF